MCFDLQIFTCGWLKQIKLQCQKLAKFSTHWYCQKDNEEEKLQNVLINLPVILGCSRTRILEDETGVLRGRTGILGGRTGKFGGKTGILGCKTGILGGRIGIIEGWNGILPKSTLRVSRRWLFMNLKNV